MIYVKIEEEFQSEALIMKNNNYFKSICLHACVYYTITTFLLIFLFWLVSNDITRAMHPVSLMLILPFSLGFAAANALFQYEKMTTWTRVLSHYAITMASIWCFLFLPNKAEDQPASGALILYLILTLIYAIVMGIVLYYKGRIKRITREKSKYTSVYKNK